MGSDFAKENFPSYTFHIVSSFSYCKTGKIEKAKIKENVRKTEYKFVYKNLRFFPFLPINQLKTPLTYFVTL